MRQEPLLCKPGQPSETGRPAMNRSARATAWLLVGALTLLAAATSHAKISGIVGPSFSLSVKDGYLSSPDGASLYAWGYASGAGAMQYPGPTLIVNQGEVVTVSLTNALPPSYAQNVSIVFPGQIGVQSSGGVAGTLAQEATPGGAAVVYTFTASEPGTYLYHSGTNMELQCEMGLVGALIVRPAGFDPINKATWRAYNHAGSAYDHEYLFFLSEMDPVIHQHVEFGEMALVDFTRYWATSWFINGRLAMDSLDADFAAYLPHQPYGSLARVHPGERALVRLVGAGRDLHPFHMHGNHTLMIARDGRLLESVAGVSGPDLAVADFTFTSAPGQTIDGIFTWTGEKIGWDVYGHKPGDPMQPGEDPTDHGKPFPVLIPDYKDLTIGPMYQGSPFLGNAGALPPGEGGFNPTAGFFFMWHSHSEKELTTNNIFPGGMLTMMVIEHPNVPITD